jgi:hypothetical protein
VQLSRVTAVNLAVEYCNPTAASCSLAVAWNGTTFTGNSLSTLTATDILGHATSYTYTLGLNAGLTQIQRPSGVTTTITYAPINGAGTQPLVASVSNGVGTWTYSYGLGLANLLASTTVTDPFGHTRTVTFAPVIDNGPGTVMTLTDTDALNHTTTYIRDIHTDLITRVTLPEGNYTNYTYDGRGNVTELRRVAKPGAGLADYVITATYPASCTAAGVNYKTCNKPISVVEAGAQTDFTYDLNSGSVASVTSPAGANGVRPQTRYTYTALAASYLTAPATVTAAAPVYKLTGTSSCMTLAADSDDAAHPFRDDRAHRSEMMPPI